MINIQLSAFAERIEEKLDNLKQMERRVSDPMNILTGQLETGNFDWEIVKYPNMNSIFKLKIKI